MFGEVEPELWRPVVQQRVRPLPSHRADVGCRLPCVDTPMVTSGRFRGGVSIACRLSEASALAAYRTGRAVIVASPSRCGVSLISRSCRRLRLVLSGDLREDDTQPAALFGASPMRASHRRFAVAGVCPGSVRRLLVVAGSPSGDCRQLAI